MERPKEKDYNDSMHGFGHYDYVNDLEEYCSHLEKALKQVKENELLHSVMLCECEYHTYYEWEKEENKCCVCNKMLFNPSEA